MSAHSSILPPRDSVHVSRITHHASRITFHVLRFTLIVAYCRLRMKRARHPKYPALTLLGNPRTGFPEAPQQAKLETFPNPVPQRDYVIRIDSQEFTSLCPVTGQPDFAELHLEYVPDQRC